MKHPSPLEPVLAHVRAEPSRTWSIIISFFGDAIVPRNGNVWLGTLLAFFKGMEVGETVVRSAVSRLAAEDWLSRTKIGRNSFYHLADRGRETFARATERIYHPHRQSWSGTFDAWLVESSTRESLSALEDAGFGQISPGLLIAPGGQTPPGQVLASLPLTLGGIADNMRELASRAWKLSELAGFYQGFSEVFSPLRLALARGTTLSPLEAILARVLMIHEYRRIILRDPMLPAEILPVNWPGEAAQTLCAEVYAQLLAPSEAWLNTNALGEDFQPLSENPDIYKRFK